MSPAFDPFGLSILNPLPFKCSVSFTTCATCPSKISPGLLLFNLLLTIDSISLEVWSIQDTSLPDGLV